MLRYLFDLSYERNLSEALVFYFFYIIFGYYITGILNYFVDTYSFIYKYGAWMLFVPFVFYMFVSVGIVLKKKLKNHSNINLIFYMVIITLFIPLCLGVCFICNNLVDGGFKIACKFSFLIWFFPGLILGCIPVAILSTKEDLSLEKDMQKYEQEKLEHDIKIEKQLLTERAIASKIEETKKHVNNAEEKEVSNEEE